VTTIGSSAFEYCSALKTFYGKFASKDNRCLIVDGVLNSFAPAGLTTYSIPDSVTTIGGWVFAYCDALTSVTIPDSVTTIGSGAFAYCDALKTFYGKFASEDNRCLIVDGVLNSFAPAGLTTYSIPNSVTTIGDSAFYSCDALTSVTIPIGVKTIGKCAFNGCDGLKIIYCKPVTPPSIYYYVTFDTATFEEYSERVFPRSIIKIYVPREAFNTYTSYYSTSSGRTSPSNWTIYKSYIEPYDF